MVPLGQQHRNAEGSGGSALHVCTNSPWVGEGLTPGARPRHRVTLGHCQLEGRGSPFLVVRRSEGEPLASAPVGHHVSRPYVEGGAVRGAGGAVAAGLAGERRQAASAVQGLGAAGIAGGASGVCGQVVLFLLLVCILGSALLAAVILRGGRAGRGGRGGLPEGRRRTAPVPRSAEGPGQTASWCGGQTATPDAHVPPIRVPSFADQHLPSSFPPASQHVSSGLGLRQAGGRAEGHGVIPRTGLGLLGAAFCLPRRMPFPPLLKAQACRRHGTVTQDLPSTLLWGTPKCTVWGLRGSLWPPPAPSPPSLCLPHSVALSFSPSRWGPGL